MECRGSTSYNSLCYFVYTFWVNKLRTLMARHYMMKLRRWLFIVQDTTDVSAYLRNGSDSRFAFPKVRHESPMSFSSPCSVIHTGLQT